MSELRLSFVDEIAAVSAGAWNLLAKGNDPFLSHEFLHALESSGAVSGDTGWQPSHLLIHSDGDRSSDDDGAGTNDTLVGAMPLYIKRNSYGEYVFDWSWAGAYERNGLNYYPKLVTAIPFTPATGGRLLLATGLDTTAIYAKVREAICELAERINASSWHLLFPAVDESIRWQEQGLMERSACQFHWFNNDFCDFDDYLQGFSSRKRKNLKRERRIVRDQGIILETLEGAAISSLHWDIFYECYQFTYLKRGQAPYLNKDFFLMLARTMPNALVMVMATRKDKPVGAALCFQNSSTLFGRYWGCGEEYDCLHFEACYYQGIDYCIRKGLQRFDPGAQGEHKIQRGFIPVFTRSNHWLRRDDFAQAVARALREEREHIKAYRGEAMELLPFKADAYAGSAIADVLNDGELASLQQVQQSQNEPR